MLKILHSLWLNLYILLAVLKTMKRPVVVFFLVASLMIIFLVHFADALPPPPPAPGSTEEQQTGQIVEEEVVSPQVAQPAAVNSPESSPQNTGLEERISILEDKVSDLELERGFFSTPFIIIFSINITLVIIIIYFFFLSKSQQAL